MKLQIEKTEIIEKELQLPYYFKSGSSLYGILEEEKFIEVVCNGGFLEKHKINTYQRKYFYTGIASGEEISADDFWEVYANVMDELKDLQSEYTFQKLQTI
jgi:hypothetical protein